ncbi:magnesium transporter MgtE [Desulfuromonas versatilis]|uniref:Magnesium transporter MgtE n=1 Tax=Desulfuromonas versatilis TaxID=2802975 RepID=A0ABN6E1K0_9BACT|nr:magnesium transporter [Desulfuromonas versatilis]BCR06211.1 magnesium transporter MgtE [Desulfuromonas versatilis]
MTADAKIDINALEKPWENLHELVTAGEAEPLLAFLDLMSPTETALAISRLSSEDQSRLLTLLSPADAAEVLEDISETQAADMIEELSPAHAAAILEELDSDHIADLLGDMDEDSAAAILDNMAPEEAEEARQFLEYPPDTAGGLMISECLAYREEQRISDVLTDLQANRETYADYNVQYLYVTDERQRLRGVLRMHDLLFPVHAAPLSQLMIRDPHKVRVDAGLDRLRDFFEEHRLFGAPVVDEQNRLQGVVLPEAVEEAGRKRSVRQFLGLSGIIGGEEFRSMPLLVRSGRRLSWLSLNIVLNIIAASVIAIYQDTLAAAIALAVFLPMVSDMSGCSGNQAVAVSMRELSLGLVRPGELLRVMAKEASLGVVNGLALGLLLGAVAFFWKNNYYLGLVVGGALAANTLVAVTLGGLLPLLLKRLKMDPALVSSPLLTTVTDMAGFFFVLSFATAVLPRLSGG